MKPKPHAGLGNKNAAKAPEKRRVTLSLRVAAGNWADRVAKNR